MIRIGPDFLGFLTLLVVGIVVTLILRFAAGVKIGNGTSDLVTEFVISYVGAWLSRFVIGSAWFVEVNGVALIPAILGSAALLLVASKFRGATTGSKAASS